MDTDHLLPRSLDAKFLHIPYEKRWEHLKPIIVELYMGKYGPNGKSMTTNQVLVFMRDQYSFHAAESQYRHWFNKWGVRRRILGAEKDQIVAALGKRARPGASTSNVTLNSDNTAKAVDKKQLKRYLKDQIRHHQVEPMWPGVFSSWNLPYAAYSKALGQRPGEPSPFGGTGCTPTYLSIESPAAPTPEHQPAAPSPAMKLVLQKAAQDRSSLLLQGRHRELLASCGKEDRSTLTNYLHDFYIHSFVVAKHWGRGPRADQWTAGLVSALTLGSFDMGSPASLESATSPAAISNWPDRLDAPTQLCQWVIHVRHVDYEPVPEPVVDAQDGFDIQDPRSWAEWPLDEPEQSSVSFTKSMQESIANNTFSLTPADELPIATELISQTVQQDPDSLQVDACKVAIMAGNVNLVIDLLPKLHPEGIENIHPFHLAASFLDGGKTCCSMITALSSELGPGYIFRNNHDDLGHTVIDTFMIAILRSHTSVSPEHVSTRFNPPHKFPAEEQDICGRWDPVSPAVRTLLRHGYPRIPTHWKHAFCHTAAQAICHSLIAILGSPVSPRINSLSGLFVRRCNTCGLELKLGPLHTLVVVTFHLAHRGLPGETLFGAMAMFVCLLSLGADASLKTTISVEDIFGQAKPDTCCHKPMDTADLIEAVPHDLVAQWSRDCQTGWACILQVLLLARSDGDGNSEDDSETDESDGDLDPDSEEGTRHNRCCGLGMKGVSAHDEWIVLPCGNPKLGLLWATIQVELLTYRRINIEDSWVSRRFSMDALKTWLEGGSSEFLTPLVEGRMMEEHSPCGWFHGDDFVCPVAEDVCKEHFMNMDVYDRTNFLPTPDLIDHWIDQC